jgi:hypothetical protein
VETIARLIELKPNSDEKVRAWAEHMDAHRAEALASLKAEGVSTESWFAVSLGEKEYLLCYMRADSIKGSHQVASTSEYAVDAYHHQFKVDTWVRGGGAVGRLLIDLSSDRDV